MHAWGLRLRRVSAHSHVFAHRVLSFRLAGHRRHPVSAISELNTQPTYTPVQRFKCGLSTALAWLGARVVCYAFLCMTLSFTTPRRFIPTLSRLKARSTLDLVYSWADGRILDIPAEDQRPQHFVPHRNKARSLAGPKIECDEAVTPRTASDCHT